MANAINALINATNKALGLQAQWELEVAAATKYASKVDRETAKAKLAPIVAAARGGEWNAAENTWVDPSGASAASKKWLNRWLATIYGKDESRVAPKKDAPTNLAEKYEAMTPAERKRFLKLIGVL